MRRLEDHVSPEELVNLPETMEALHSEGIDRLLFLHLEGCKECSALFEAHGKLCGLRNQKFAFRSSCPSQGVWLEFAEGFRSDQTSSLLAHAAECGNCAALLREALALMHSVEPEVPLEGLKSSTRAWQHQMAARLKLDFMRTRFPVPRSSFLSHFRKWTPRVLVLSTAAVLVAIVLGGFVIWRNANPTEAHLLALAYNQQRTLALRIPGGNPVPMASGTRGSSTVPAEPVALLELRIRAQKHLEQTPGSAYWHQVLGEVNLLDGDGTAARRNLEIAQMTDAKLPNLLPDLAGAWFEIGDKTGSAEAFAEAAELYSEQLTASKRDTSLLYYNRALCWERQGATRNAIADLQMALKTEPSAAWREVIQAEIAKLSKNSSATPKDSRFTPASQLSSNSADAHPEKFNYEDALEKATGQLLPLWKVDPKVRAELAQIAKSGLGHRDVWLRDWLASVHTPLSEDGDRHLATAVLDGSAGNPQDSLAESQRALSSYEKAGNVPGRLRALLAESYAFQRLDRAHECLAVAADLEREPRVLRYAWIHTQLALEEGSCRGLSGEYDSAESSFNKTIALSIESGLEFLHIRALGARALLLDFRGTPIGAWQLNTEAMRLCTRTACPPVREYQILYNMAHSAENLGLHHVALELMRTGEKVVSASGDVTAEAYALETLAIMSGNAGDYATSDSAFSAAANLANTSLKNSLAHLDVAEWQADRAEVLLRKGDRAQALTLLRQSGPSLLASDYRPGRISYWRGLAAAQLASRDPADALASAEAAVSEADKSLATLGSSMEREQWQRENAATYAELVNVRLSRGEDSEALEAWENFRSLPYAASDAAAISDRPGPPIDSTPAKPPEGLALIIAAVDNSYVGWLVVPKPLHVIRTAVLGDRTAVHNLAVTFYHLCSDRNSNMTDVQAVGAHLFAIVFQPFSGELQGTHNLWLDLDPSLSAVPFAALPLPAGAWLGDSLQIALLPPWWNTQSKPLNEAESMGPESHLLVINGLGSMAVSPGAYSEAPGIAKLFAHALILNGKATTPELALKELRSADIVHFSGHAVNEGGSQFLLDPDSDARASLTAASLTSLRLRSCKLAFLAACDTTGSDPDRQEPLLDLREALLRAGAQAVIASNWDVDDRSTEALSLAFYRELLHGNSPLASLAAAERTVSSHADWKHPYYWASFQLFVN
jgi:CHAT domain-containing protein